MTLMAAVCNKTEMQATLPQVLLPKHPGRTNPSKKLLATWEATGAPIQVWHGTDGWVNAPTMTRWLQTIRSWVNEKNPRMDIVLIMDCFSVHTSKRTLMTCRRLNINVVFVPARMTWLLQCLDTDVFAPLKKEIRRETAMRELASDSGLIRPVEHIEAIGVAIHHILVERNWSMHLNKVGAGQDLLGLRNSLNNLVKHMDLNAKAPTEAELQRVLNLRGTQAKILSRFLCSIPPSHNDQGDLRPLAHAPSHATVPVKTEPVSVPNMQTGGSTSSASGAGRPWAPEAYLPGSGDIPKARRLQLPARNIHVKPEPEEISGPAAGTRSRTKRSASVLDLTQE